MKKIISTMLMVIVLFNFIFCNNSYADTLSDDVYTMDSGNSVTAESQESLVNEGKTTDKSETNGESSSLLTWNILGNIFGTIAGILAAVVNLFPMLLQVILSATTDTNQFTIEKTVFNQIGLFDINYFNFENTYEIGSNSPKTINVNSTIKTLKSEIAKYFILVRLIAIALSLLILIYVGIRMALSTISADKAKYKEMLIAWVESIVLLFLMQYIIVIMINIGKIFGNIVYDLKCALETSGNMSFETDILDKIYSFMMLESGWTYVLYSIVFWFLIFIQIKFYLMYFKRVITVGFLILISPLITIVYSIDKVGDGKAQSFSVWFNELAMNIFIQPIHAFIYLVFMYTAGEIAKLSILVALFFLLSLTKVEKMILYLFNLRNVVSLKPIDEQKTKI